MCNLTHISEFYLLGLSDDPELQPMLFGLFLSMYLITVLGNLLIIQAITNDPHLHTPMYFFLSNLSLVDIGFTSTTVPKMLVDIHSHRAIAYIISSVLRMSSSSRKYKAFSTCGSHLSVVCLFFGTALGVYFESAVSHSSKGSAVASVMYTVVSPMLNPFIYSLRNRDISRTLRRLGSRILGTQDLGRTLN
ncbi:olfactory receptor 7E178-like [Thomomys bottae]